MKNKSLEEIEKSTKSFLSTSEAAVVLGISPSTLRKRADEYSELFPIQRGRKEIQNEKGYGVNMNKYMSIKVKPDSKDIRTYRLGDGYFLEHLNYRIEHKNFEMPLSEIAKYSGIQREYAICLRQIQMILYKSPEPERPHYVSYRSVLKNFELLNFLHDNNIHTLDAFKNVVDKAEGRYTEVLNAKKKLEDKISETEKIIADFPRYKKLVRKNPNTTRGAYGKRAILRWFW